MTFSCRTQCGACCIAPSISSAIPGMPNGKPAGVPCIQLDASMNCKIFDQANRPAVCSGLQPSLEMCGQSTAEAIQWLTLLEKNTAP